MTDNSELESFSPYSKHKRKNLIGAMILASVGGDEVIVWHGAGAVHGREGETIPRNGEVHYIDKLMLSDLCKETHS